MYGAFCLNSWAEVGTLQLILEFGESCRWRGQTQFGSGEISGNQLYVCWRFVWRNRFRWLAKLRSRVDFAEIVCRFRRDRVLISFGALKSRSCVDFARCSLEFGSDLKNLHWRGEYRERIKIRDRVFKLYDMISIDRAVDQYEQGVGRSTGLSTDVARGTWT